ncbi:methyltransferase domain-containing protein [Micromonospora taraxaci]|uniref:class I SAM-dependent methyltransferase n=1 Tax=Micromonospora taraxaci TaxID=1316803 RepID=UPI0033C17C09
MSGSPAVATNDRKASIGEHVNVRTTAAWNQEYTRQGIPSSHREEPSGVLVWALDNLRHLTDGPMSAAVDLGCGTGRNSAAMAATGITVSAIDLSDVAIATARNRYADADIDFRVGSVVEPLPFKTGSFQFAADIFVYFHQLSDVDRRRYRREIHRVLEPGGLLLVSLATDGDGYYGSCEKMPNWRDISAVPLTWDPAAEVGNILPTYDEFLVEFSDMFDFQMSWRKRKFGDMHGKRYLRETVAMLWQAVARPAV